MWTWESDVMLSLELRIVRKAMRMSPPMVSFKLHLRNALKSSFYKLTTDKTRAPINTKLTPTIEELIKGNLLPKKEQEELVEKYPRTENCKLLVSSKLNRNIWNQLSPSTKNNPQALQKAQKLFIFSIYANINAWKKASNELKATLAHFLVTVHNQLQRHVCISC